MGTLYIVGTPIGNLQDVTLRALEVLKSVKVIACEDTRVTKKLLGHFGIGTDTISLHHHSSDAVIEKLVYRIVMGEDVAYVSDAGTPGISDPGGKLTEEAYKKGVRVVPIPGASSVIAALSISGFPSDQFQFLGYFPRKKGRQTLLANMSNFALTTVFFEAPYRIVKTLEDIAMAMPQREVVVGREMTKQFEEIMRGTAKQISEHFKVKEPKGEYVIVIRGK
jgi:16S rRNA (cytidine1402-2'-O)-methyltransferase